MAAVQPWFHTSFFKLSSLSPAGKPGLEDNYYEVKAILYINKYGTHAKVKLIGYDFT